MQPALAGYSTYHNEIRRREVVTHPNVFGGPGGVKLSVENKKVLGYTGNKISESVI